VAFFVDGVQAGLQTAEKIPAGANRNEDRALLRQAIVTTPGRHRFEAKITNAERATVLESSAALERVQ
jgi:hypothetical protein